MAKPKGPDMNENGRQTGGQSNRGESARDLVAQSMYHLVRLTRLGIQAAASGMERLEESMVRRQRERAETRPMGEAPPTARPADTGAAEESRAPMPGQPGEQPGEPHRPSPPEPGPSRH